MSRLLIRLCGVALAVAVVMRPICGVQAQNYPDRPVKIIVPSGPAGGYDFVGRVVADQLTKEFGAKFIVENHAGAGTLLGTQFAAAAAPDGYTLVVGGLSNMVFNASIYAKPGYDPAKDFVPVALAYTLPYVLVARKDLPQSSLKEIVAYAKANPGKMLLANGGTGSGQHIMASAFKQMTGITMVDVPYKAAQAVYPDLLSGRVDMFFDPLPTARGHLMSGQVKAIAMISPRRSRLFPQVPTSAEEGFPKLEIESWIGLFAPAKTPAPVLQALRTKLREGLNAPELKKRLEAGGGDVMHLSQDETDKMVREEYARWTKLIRDAGIHAN